MKKIELYESALNGFQGTKEQVIENDKKVKLKKKKESERKKSLKVQEEIKNNIRLTATSIKDLERKINDYFKNTIIKDGKMNLDISVEFNRLRFNKEVSNSHSSPIDGVRNWRCKPDKPKNYPGFYGRITINIKQQNYRGFTTDYVTRIPGINTGSGGGGEYELSLYLQDFPLIEKAWNEKEDLKNNIHYDTEQYDKIIKDDLENVNLKDEKLIKIQEEIKSLDSLIKFQKDLLHKKKMLSYKLVHENTEKVKGYKDTKLLLNKIKSLKEDYKKTTDKFQLY